MKGSRTFLQKCKVDQILPWNTSPRFQLGQVVCHDLQIDDQLDERHGQTFRDYGQVTGLFWNAGKGGYWTYLVKWVESNSCPFDTTYIDEIEESELKPLKNENKLTEAEVSLSIVRLFEDFSEHKGKVIDERTLEKYQALQTRLTQFFGSTLAISLTATKAETFIEFLKKFQKPITIKDRLVILNACWQWGIRTGRVSQNPWEGIQIKLVPKQRPKPFTKAEIDGILKALDAGSYAYYKPYVEFLFLTGCRTAEAIGLRWQHVADDFSSIWVGESITRGKAKSTKTNRDRIFPCNTRLATFLEAIKPPNAEPNDLVFPTPAGCAMDDNNFCKRIWRPALVLAGVAYRRPYNTRHTFVSHCLAGGMNPVEVAAIVGHDVQTLYRCYAGVIAGRPRVPEFM